MNFKIVAGLMIGAALATSAFACNPTASVSPQHYPGAQNIPSNNNLILPAGKSLEAEGQKLVITGQLLDKNCLPVPQAIVEIWQVNPYGRWILAGRDELANPNATFAGAGRTYTDTDGNFMFTTAFPAGVGKRAPNINVKVKPEGMKEFSTVLYFENDSRNETDEGLKKLKADARNSVTLKMDQGRELHGSTTIVLPGAAPYRTY